MANDLKEMFRKIQSDRYKHKGTYIFDRWIFQIMMFMIFGFLFFVAQSHNYQMDYYQCMGGEAQPIELGNSGDCENPFYKEPTWKNQQYLPPGEYGTDTRGIINICWLVSMGLFILAFVINHLIYNKGKLKVKIEEVQNEEFFN